LNKKIVFTDFDGTYIKGDSYIRSLIFFTENGKLLTTVFKLMLIALEHYFKFITRNEAKSRSFELVFKDMSIDRIERKLKSFHRQLHVFPKVKKKIVEMKKMGCKIVAVTASPDIYMEYMAEKFGFDGCISTLTEKEDGVLTGKLKRNNCNYAEKVVRIKESEFYDPEGYIVVFGNSKGDEDMFRMASEFYFVDKSGNLKKGRTPW
jgi:phosphatidylglycerophosphatase C